MDTYFGVARPNWMTTTGLQSVTTNMEYLTIYTGLDIRPGTAAVVTTTLSAGSTASSVLAVSSATGITLGMTLSGNNQVVGAPLVTAISGSNITVSIPQTITSGMTVVFTANNVANLNKLIEIISERGQPIIMGAPSGTGPFSIFMATEHLGWSVLQGANVTMPLTAASTSSTTLTVASTAALSGTYQVYGTGVPVNPVPTVTVASGTTLTANSAQTIANNTSLTFSPVPIATGARLIDRIMVDGVNYGWTQDATAGTLGVSFGSVLT